MTTTLESLHQPSSVSFVESRLPEFEYYSDEKRRYLSWRISGFTPEESLKYSGVTKAEYDCVFLLDKDFIKLEKIDLRQMRDELRDAFLEEQHTRNMRIAYEIDARVFEKAFDTGVDGLGENEMDYLKKIRGQYSPKARSVLGGGSGGAVPSWLAWISGIKRLNGGDNAFNDGKGFEYERVRISNSPDQGDEVTELGNESHIIEAEHPSSSERSKRDSGNEEHSDTE
jgi:hypothetical protein